MQNPGMRAGCCGLRGQKPTGKCKLGKKEAAKLETLHSTWRFMGSYEWVISPLFGGFRVFFPFLPSFAVPDLRVRRRVGDALRQSILHSLGPWV